MIIAWKARRTDCYNRTQIWIPAILTLSEDYPSMTDGFPPKGGGGVLRSFGVFLLLAWTSCWTKSRSAGDLIRHDTSWHRDVTLMCWPRPAGIMAVHGIETMTMNDNNEECNGSNTIIMIIIMIITIMVIMIIIIIIIIIITTTTITIVKIMVMMMMMIMIMIMIMIVIVIMIMIMMIIVFRL